MGSGDAAGTCLVRLSLRETPPGGGTPWPAEGRVETYANLRCRTFVLFLFNIALAEVLPPRLEVALRRRGLGGRGGLRLPIPHPGRRETMVIVRAVGHSGRVRRALRPSSSRLSRFVAFAACRGAAPSVQAGPRVAGGSEQGGGQLSRCGGRRRFVSAAGTGAVFVVRDVAR